MERGVSEQVCRIRHQHYDEKRKGKVILIEETIRGGMLQSLKETFGPLDQKSDPLHLSLTSQFQRFKRGGKTPRLQPT